MLQRSRVYQSKVCSLHISSKIEVKFQCFTDNSICRLVVVGNTLQTVPECWAHRKYYSGFPCLHGTSVLAENYGATYLHRFLFSSPHTAVEATMQFRVLPSPNKSGSYAFFTTVKTLMWNGDCITVPKAIAPPRGRPAKCRELKERLVLAIPYVRKSSSYTCSLCRLEGRTLHGV